MRPAYSECVAKSTFGQEQLCFGGLSIDGIRRWRADTRTVESIVQFDANSRPREFADRAVSIDVGLIDADFLPFTGRKPLIGRNFTTDEASTGGHPVLLLSEGLWRREYGASPDVLGKVVEMDSARWTIIGVMPASVSLPDFQGGHPEIWMPLASDPLVRIRGAGGVAVRLRPGVDRKAAEAEVAAIDAQAPGDAPPKGIQWRWRLTRPQDHLGIRDSLVMIAGAVGLLLLIACTNVAHLLLARGAARERELAVRHALGAGRGRLLRQLVSESMLLASAGGALAILIARGGLWLLGLTHPADMPMLSFVSTRNEVVSMASVLSLVAGLAIGIIAGLKSAHRHLAQSLRASASSAPLSSRRLRGSLIVGEVALSTTLLVGALLLIHAVVDLQHTPLGFDPNGLYSIGFLAKGCLGTAMPCVETPETRRAFAARLRERGAHIPGVEQITVARDAISGTTSPYPFETPEHSTTGGNLAPTALNEIAPDYLAVMGTRLIAGRTFDAGSAARNEVIITRSLADRLWPRESPIGHRLRRATPYPDGTIQPWQTVVGEAPDVVRRLVDGAEPGLYVPLDNSRPNPGTALIVRARGQDPTPVLRQLATSIASEHDDGQDHQCAATSRPIRRRPAIPDAHPHHLRRARRGARECRPVRRHLVHGWAAHTRDRHTDDPRSNARCHRPTGGRGRPSSRRDWHCAWTRGRDGGNATHSKHALRRVAFRRDLLRVGRGRRSGTSLVASALPMVRATGIDPAITLRAE